MTKQTDKRLLLLHHADNILVSCDNIDRGETIAIEGQLITIETEIELGHKVARTNIATGDRIIKYGVAIGSSKQAIAQGEHVHLHNMKSDYIPSYQRSGVVDNSVADGAATEILHHEQ